MFSWWQWLLISGGLALVAWIAYAAAEDGGDAAGCLGPLVALPAGLGSIIAFAIGVIRFVKWVWAS
jgi:hypothetical protein